MLENSLKVRRDYNKYPIVLDMKKDLNNNRSDISFYKYREDYKPFLANDDGSLSQIEEDVVEVVNCCFDWNYNIVAIQYLHEGVKENGIKKYLNSFILNKKFEVKIEKIYENTDLHKILSSNRILSIDTELNNLPQISGIKKDNFWSLANHILSNSETTPKVVLSIYNKERGGTLSGNALELMLNSLGENSENNEIINLINITYELNGKTITKNIKELKEPLFIEILKKHKNPSHDLIMEELANNYVNTQNKCIKACMNTPLETISPDEKFFIKLEPEENEKF